jgi:hypothetical protein
MTFIFPIESGHIVMFRRSVGESTGVDFSPQGGVAPPTFVAAGAHFMPDYPLRPQPSRPWFGSGRGPGTSEDGQGNRMQAEQHYRYFGPIRTGDVLVGNQRPGRSWSKDGRSGNLRFTEEITEYRTFAGKLTVESRLVRVRLPVTRMGGEA